jgi:maleate isomerase
MDRHTPARRFEGETKFLATVTPSGNTVVERITAAFLSLFPGVVGLHSRSAVFGSTDRFPDSYDWDSMLAAARLLGHARPNVVVWNGSKGGSVGPSVERELVARMAEAAGCPATTSLAAEIEALEAVGAKRIAFVTPYGDAYQAKVERNFAALGFETVARANSRMTDNLSYASTPLETVRAQARSVAAAKPDAILGWCTNYPSAVVAAEMEAETGIPFHDATTIVLRKALRMMDVDPAPAAPAWGGIFARG